GATPLVDTQNVRKQTVMSNELLETLPLSTKNVNTVATITPRFHTPRNAALSEEVTLARSGISAESNADGVVANMVPKEGGNSFRGQVSGLFSGSKLQSADLTDALLEQS